MIGTYKIIDSDSHVLESPDFWGRYIDPKFRDQAPRYIIEPDGTERLRVEGRDKVFPQGMGGTGSFGRKPEVVGKVTPYLKGRRGGFDPRARQADMDADGVDASFLYPTLGLYVVGMMEDPEFAAASCRAYNRWLAEYCSVLPGRLYGAAMLPMQSVELAVEELRYARTVLDMPAAFLRPNPYKGRSLHDPAYNALWAEAQALDCAIALHEGSQSGMPTLGEDRFEGRMARHIISHTMEMMAACLSMILGGVCDRYPKLRIGFLESGGGWIAPWLDRMDRHVNGPLNDSTLPLRPSEYFKRQCWISFEPVEGTLACLADYIGPHKILWAVDYPHIDGFPGAPSMIAGMPGLSDKTKRTILSEAAIEFYKRSPLK